MQRLNLSPSLEISRIIYGMWRLDSDQNKSTNHINNKINLFLNDEFDLITLPKSASEL